MGAFGPCTEAGRGWSQAGNNGKCLSPAVPTAEERRLTVSVVQYALSASLTLLHAPAAQRRARPDKRGRLGSATPFGGRSQQRQDRVKCTPAATATKAAVGDFVHHEPCGLGLPCLAVGVSRWSRLSCCPASDVHRHFVAPHRMAQLWRGGVQACPPHFGCRVKGTLRPGSSQPCCTGAGR